MSHRRVEHRTELAATVTGGVGDQEAGAVLRERGYLAMGGQIVDATIVPAFDG